MLLLTFFFVEITVKDSRLPDWFDVNLIGDLDGDLLNFDCDVTFSFPVLHGIPGRVLTEQLSSWIEFRKLLLFDVFTEIALTAQNSVYVFSCTHYKFNIMDQYGVFRSWSRARWHLARGNSWMKFISSFKYFEIITGGLLLCVKANWPPITSKRFLCIKYMRR
jgi:hypothetical protein